jgi:hypothetical protein
MCAPRPKLALPVLRTQTRAPQREPPDLVTGMKEDASSEKKISKKKYLKKIPSKKKSQGLPRVRRERA